MLAVGLERTSVILTANLGEESYFPTAMPQKKVLPYFLHQHGNGRLSFPPVPHLSPEIEELYGSCTANTFFCRQY